MKNILVYVIGLLLWSSCAKYTQELNIIPCEIPSDLPDKYSKAGAIKQALQQLVDAGVPGCAMAVYSPEGWWETAAGFAKIENETPMQNCHLQYLQSISKTYMAVAVLKLYEQGKIIIDAPITQYLPEQYSRYVNDAAKITVRMLLNHTSGIPEYNFAPAYVTYLLQHPDYIFTPTDYLAYIRSKPLDFEPGSKYAYRNTNYLLLALMVDAITGDHARFITETIFQPLDLPRTFYKNEDRYLKSPRLVNTYWDRHSDGVLENVSQMQRNNVASLIGDDGIVTTPLEAVKFLKGLMEGQLLAPATLELMKTWVTDSKGNPRYGLGLAYHSNKGIISMGHSGGGIGAGCELYYFPAQKVYVFIAINLGTVTDSPLHERAGAAREKIYEVLLR
ncbi:MAG: beta-lactamase family protein [Saprospiraceae bacterium]|jgi:D-alanyl-D-alanine carboxypeptidase|nr:beta-lactamase family protein [Saprospiraceae bacterium]